MIENLIYKYVPLDEVIGTIDESKSYTIKSILIGGKYVSHILLPMTDGTPKGEAIKFANWIAKNGYYNRINGMWEKCILGGYTESVSSELLYNIFKIETE